MSTKPGVSLGKLSVSSQTFIMNIGKPKSRLPKVRSLTSDAKSVKRRLDESFIERPDGGSAVATDESRGDISGNAAEGPSGTANHLQDSHVNSHQALEEPTDGRVLDEPPHDRAADTAAGAYIKPEDNTEAEDDTEMAMEVKSSTVGEELSNRISQAGVAPAKTTKAIDAAARQRVLELGLQLADHSAAGQDSQTRLGDMNEVDIKREEEGSE